MPPASSPWIQVFGEIAIHRATRDPLPVAGSTKTLLAALIAAGSAGATIEDLAQIYWGPDRPQSWALSLRSTISHLRSQVAPGFAVTSENDHVTLIAENGWIDAWRLEQHGPFDERPDWVRAGRPYGDVYGLPSVDAAIKRLTALLPPDEGSRPSTPTPAVELRATTIAILTGPPDKHQEVLRLSRQENSIETLVVGDKHLLMPLGPFSIAFPGIRNDMEKLVDRRSDAAALRAWHIISDAVRSPESDAPRPYRLIIDKAHELDTMSLALTSLLVERRPSSNFSMVICTSSGVGDLRWLDFLDQARTAGARIIELN